MTEPTPLSRRDFVTSTTLGAVGLWRGTAGSSWRTEERILYVGTYTAEGRREGIHILRMDVGTGALRRVSAIEAGPNPSYLALHPNGRVLYSVNEVSEMDGVASGAVRAFTIAAGSGDLTFLNEHWSVGAAPCYVSTDRKGRALLVANYVSGTVAILPIDAVDGSLTRATHAVQHTGSGPVTARQKSAHAHYIMPHPNNRFVLAADLGVDRVIVYRYEEARTTLVHIDASDVVLNPGTGPRHLAFHPTLPLVFVAGELNSTITMCRCDPETGALSVVQTLSTLPSTHTGDNFPADIHVAPDGRTVYLSNRGHNSVAVFSIPPATGRMALVQHVSTGGDWPRNFTIDPTGRWVLVANQRSGSIVVFERNAGNGRLTPTAHRIDLPSPVCLRFGTA